MQSTKIIFVGMLAAIMLLSCTACSVLDSTTVQLQAGANYIGINGADYSGTISNYRGIGGAGMEKRYNSNPK